MIDHRERKWYLKVVSIGGRSSPYPGERVLIPAAFSGSPQTHPQAES